METGPYYRFPPTNTETYSYLLCMFVWSAWYLLSTISLQTRFSFLGPLLSKLAWNVMPLQHAIGEKDLFLNDPECVLFLRTPGRCLLICLPPVIVNMGGGWSPQQVEEIYWSRSKVMTTVIPLFYASGSKIPPFPSFLPPLPPSVGKEKRKEQGEG